MLELTKKMSEYWIQVFFKAIGIYTLLIAIFGILLNSLTFYVCIRLKKNSTFIFMLFFAVSNIFTLCWWNLGHFTTQFLNVYMPHISLFGCKFGSFIQFASLQICAWLLVSFFFEKYLTNKLVIF